VPGAILGGVDMPDEGDEVGEAPVLPFVCLAAIAPSAERAFDELLRERAVGVPLTSFSVSFVGSRLTNSFCSN